MVVSINYESFSEHTWPCPLRIGFTSKVNSFVLYCDLVVTDAEGSTLRPYLNVLSAWLTDAEHLKNYVLV